MVFELLCDCNAGNSHSELFGSIKAGINLLRGGAATARGEVWQ